MRRGSRHALWIVPLASTAVLGGCANGTTTASAASNARSEAVMSVVTTTTSTTVVMAEVALDEAARRAIAAGPSTATTTMSVDDELGFEVSVRRPPTGDQAQVTLTAPGDSFEMLVMGPTTYLAADGLPGGATWIQMSTDDLLATTGLDPVTIVGSPLSASLDQLTRVGVGQVPIGSGSVASQPTSLYRFSASVNGLVDQAAAWGQLDVDATATPLSGTAIVEVHADADGRVVQLSYDQTFAQAGQRRIVRITERYSGFGDPAELAAPAADTTITLDELEALDPAAMPQRS